MRRLPRTFNESMGHVAQERREADKQILLAGLMFFCMQAATTGLLACFSCLLGLHMITMKSPAIDPVYHCSSCYPHPSTTKSEDEEGWVEVDVYSFFMKYASLIEASPKRATTMASHDKKKPLAMASGGFESSSISYPAGVTAIHALPPCQSTISMLSSSARGT